MTKQVLSIARDDNEGKSKKVLYKSNGVFYAVSGLCLWTSEVLAVSVIEGNCIKLTSHVNDIEQPVTLYFRMST